MSPEWLKQAVAEFIGTFALIFVGIGAIQNLGSIPGGLLGIALAHGLTIAVMVSATGAISGGHLNPAVTLGILVGGRITVKHSIVYWIAQLSGATLAALLAGNLLATGTLRASEVIINGTPALGAGIGTGTGIAIEAILTFFLVFVVYGSAVDARGPRVGGLAIGLTVALDILFGGPFTGGAMNVARWLGPALAANHWKDAIVYIAGPLLGGAAAGLVYGRFLIHPED